MADKSPQDEDPFFSLTDLADSGLSLTNAQIDEVLYGQGEAQDKEHPAKGT